MTAGALQSMVYLSHNKPFDRPVIIGSELVSFSIIATCRHAKIQPVALLEENSRSTAWSFLRWLPRLLGVKFISNTRLVEILGKEHVTGIKISDSSGNSRHLQCDGVVFTGQFTPEASLARMGHLEIDSRSKGPVVDQFGRCSDADYFAAGNVLRPVETAGWCWKEGIETAQMVAASLSGNLPNTETEKQLQIDIKSLILKYCVPQRISRRGGVRQLQLRFTKPAKGRLIISSKSGELWSKKIKGFPEKRVLISLPKIVSDSIMGRGEDLTIYFKQ
jgi:hypothetical protein